MKIGPLVVELKFEKRPTYLAGLLYRALAHIRGQTYYPDLGVHEVGFMPTERFPLLEDVEGYVLSKCNEGTEIEIIGTATMKRYDSCMREFCRYYETVIFYRYKEKA